MQLQKLTTTCYSLRGIQAFLFLLSFFLFSTNPVSAQISCADAMILYEGSGEAVFCQGDGFSDVVTFDTDNHAMPYAFVVVDENDIILHLSSSNDVDFDNLPTGSLKVYAFSYLGPIFAQVGDPLFDTNLAGVCYNITDNFIAVSNEMPIGGNISTSDGQSEITLCVGDDVPDEVNFVSTGTGGQQQFLITDSDFNLLTTSTGSFDFEPAGTGVCLVWGINYLGDFTPITGQSIFEQDFGAACYAISENAIEVTRLFPDAGSLSYADGSNSFESCTSLDPTGSVTLQSFNANPNVAFTYVLIDAASGNIVSFITGNSIDLASLADGSYEIHGISYTGNLIVGPGDSYSGQALSDECDDRSDNFATLIKRVQHADNIFLEDGSDTATVCVGDGVADELTFVSSYVGNDNFIFLITNEGSSLLGTSESSTIDFEGAGTGICRVWGLVYSGDLTVSMGDNIGLATLSTECFDLSDGYVLVNRNGPDGGAVSFSDGTTDFLSCSDVVPTGTLDLVASDTDPSSDYIYVVVNSSTGLIESTTTSSIDISSVPAGMYDIYGVSYVGNFTAQAGEAFAGNALSDGCVDVSDNTCTMTIRIQQAGTVLLEDGTDAITICVGDGIADALTFQSSYVGDDNFIYLITDNDGNLLQTSNNATIDFEGAGAGICRVWGLVYSGDLIVQADDLVTQVALSDECFDLSDSNVLVNRNGPEAGNITFDSGATNHLICNAGQGNGSVGITIDGQATDLLYSFIVVNTETNIIAAITTNATIDATTLDLGTYSIYGVSHIGTISAAVDEDFDINTISTDCFDVSDNAITLANRSVDAGTLIFADGNTTAFICPNDGQPDILQFTSDYAGTDNFVFVIVDENNQLISVNNSGSEDFDAPGPEVVKIIGLAYSGNLLLQPGDIVDATDNLSTECFDLSDNELIIDRNGPNGGNVSLEGGETEIAICVGDGAPDELTFMTDGQGNQLVWLITDSDNNVLEFNTTGSMDFEGAGEGLCRVWALAYQGDLLIQAGDNIDNAEFSTDCSSLSGNSIAITRTFVDGGTVAISDGSTSAIICAGDGVPDFYEFVATQTATHDYSFIVTDDNNEVLAILESNSINFDLAAPGNCRVWGVSHAGALTAVIGDNLNDVPASADCFELSENFITITREEVVGGVVSMDVGGSEVLICPFDNNPDLITFSTTGTSTGFYRYILTDANNIIIGVVSGDTQDFNSIDAPNEIRVWGLAYTPLINAPSGENILETALSTNCYDLSENFLTIFRVESNGGEVATSFGETELYLCTDDGIDDLVEVVTSGESSGSYVLFITDDLNNILVIEEDVTTINFEGVAAGNCRIWGMAYTGMLTADLGVNVTNSILSDDCFSLSSNFIEVTRGTLNAGSISMNNGLPEIYTCPGDGEPNVVSFDTLGVGNTNYVYVLTDGDNQVISLLNDDTFDVDPLAEGTYLVYGVSYTGNLIVGAGEDILTAALADGCYALSSNHLSIFHYTPNAGEITANGGLQSVDLCIGDGNPDIVELEVTNASNANYVFLVIDQDSFIVGSLNDPTFDFDQSAEGDWEIYGLSYTGSLSAIPGSNIYTDQLASGCVDLTAIPVFLDKTLVDGGTIFSGLGTQDLFICPDDGEADIFSFINSSTSMEATYQYVLTNSDNFVLNFFNSSIDFELTAGFTELRVWGISYTGNLTLGLGQNITTTPLSDECYHLSENNINVFRDTPAGGSLSFDDGSTSTVLCHSNSMPGLNVNVSGASQAGYAYFLTDTANVVLSTTLNDNFINFDDVAAGPYRIWGLSYTGTVTVILGDTIPLETMATSCHEISANFLEVERTETINAGEISTNEGLQTIYVCEGDGNVDLFQFVITSTEPNNGFVVTDTMGQVLIPQIVGNVLNFDDAQAGVCRVYNIAFTGDWTINFGDNIFTDILSTDCWALSDNYVTVVRQNPEGGEVFAADGSSSVVLFVDDGESDVVVFENDGALLTPYQYIITDENNNVLALVQGNSMDFEGVAPGICHVWGLSYTGTLMVNVGDNLDVITDLSSDCYDLSENFISILRFSSIDDGGNESLSQGDNFTDAPVMKIAPVPAQDYIRINIEYPSTSETSEQWVDIFDVRGVQVVRQKFNQESTSYRLDIQSLQTGVYFIRWSNGKTYATQRFLKQ